MVAGDDPNATAKRLLITVAVTTVVWLAVTFVTKPEAEATLTRFYERVRPAGGGWGPIAQLVPGGSEDNLGIALVDWVAGLGLVYGTLFGIGRLVLGELAQGLGVAVMVRVLGRIAPYHPAAAVFDQFFGAKFVHEFLDVRGGRLLGEIDREK